MPNVESTHFGHDPHHHHPLPENGRALAWALMLTLGFAVVEAVGGWWAGSLALISDAGHMLTDAFSLGLAALAARIARQPPSARHSYGLARAEVVGGLVNGLLMLGVITFILIEAVDRLRHPQAVAGGWVMLIALIGLGINGLVAWVLSRGGAGLNVHAALLHVLGDLLGSVAALAAGAVVYFTGFTPADPILSLVVAGLILVATLRLLREVLHVLMEGVPASLDLDQVGQALAQVPGVESVHDLHIWTLASGRNALSAHVVLPDLARWPRILAAMQQLLHDRFGIEHVTLQPELRPPARAVTPVPSPRSGPPTP
ncbi:cation diffusion facilitator family transporter [Thiobacter aerophilum]|uniref:Cation diffusion facilitator family transporter n=1 Tax=Thiobacter aerophilum TaxID=3121275 RepID=A0ABV0EAQ2_9BURK